MDGSIDDGGDGGLEKKQDENKSEWEWEWE